MSVSNIFAHYLIDKWFDEVVKSHTAGQVRMFRYADDLVICCQYEKDAVRVREALGKRLAKFNLKLHEDKMKSVNFSKRKSRQGVKQGTFDFLGFTFYLNRCHNPDAKDQWQTLLIKAQSGEGLGTPD